MAATRRVFKVLLAAATVVVTMATHASYMVPTDGSRSWGDPNVWYSDAAGTQHINAVPTGANNNNNKVNIQGDGVFTIENPALIESGTLAKCYTLNIAPIAGETVVLRVEEGGALDKMYASGYTTFTASAVGKNGRGILIFNGGAMTNTSCFSVGCNVGSEGIVSNLAGNVWLHAFAVGNLAGSRGSFVVAGGNLVDSNWNYPQVWHIGREGTGVLELHSGTIDGNDVTVPSKGGGTQKLHLGTVAGGHGTFKMSGGILEGVYLRAGYAANATGIVEVTGGTSRNIRTFDVGYDGYGEATIKANWDCGHMQVGVRGEGVGILTVENGVTNNVNQFGNQDDGLAYIGGKPDTEGGYGTVLLKGGALRVSRDLPTGNTLFIGCNDTALGVVRGWGAVLPYSTTSTYDYKMYVALGNATIVADGFGEDRLLNFSEVFVTNRIDAAASLAGTNGWYAVNGGCVTYPRRWDLATLLTRTIGTSNDRTSPDLVNSAKVTFSGAIVTGGYLHCALYAPDRSDIHMDALSVPDGGEVIGVWKLGMSTVGRNWQWGKGTTISLNSKKIGVDFRYDAMKLKSNSKLHLYRWTGSSWACVARAVPDAANPIVSASGLEEIQGAPANIGLFALVRRPVTGAMIIFR